MITPTELLIFGCMALIVLVGALIVGIIQSAADRIIAAIKALTPPERKPE